MAIFAFPVIGTILLGCLLQTVGAHTAITARPCTKQPYPLDTSCYLEPHATSDRWVVKACPNNFLYDHDHCSCYHTTHYHRHTSDVCYRAAENRNVEYFYTPQTLTCTSITEFNTLKQLVGHHHQCLRFETAMTYLYRMEMRHQHHCVREIIHEIAEYSHHSKSHHDCNCNSTGQSLPAPYEDVHFKRCSYHHSFQRIFNIIYKSSSTADENLLCSDSNWMWSTLYTISDDCLIYLITHAYTLTTNSPHCSCPSSLHLEHHVTNAPPTTQQTVTHQPVLQSHHVNCQHHHRFNYLYNLSNEDYCVDFDHVMIHLYTIHDSYCQELLIKRMNYVFGSMRTTPHNCTCTGQRSVPPFMSNNAGHYSLCRQQPAYNEIMQYLFFHTHSYSSICNTHHSVWHRLSSINTILVANNTIPINCRAELIHHARASMIHRNLTCQCYNRYSHHHHGNHQVTQHVNAHQTTTVKPTTQTPTTKHVTTETVTKITTHHVTPMHGHHHHGNHQVTQHVNAHQTTTLKPTTQTPTTKHVTTETVTKITTHHVTPMHGLHSCDKLQTVTLLAHEQHANASGLQCKDGSNPLSEATVIKLCNATSSAHWIRGYRVLHHCDDLPLYTAIAAFGSRKYTHDGVAGVFLGCENKTTIKVATEDCGSGMEVFHIHANDRDLYSHDSINYFTIRW